MMTWGNDRGSVLWRGLVRTWSGSWSGRRGSLGSLVLRGSRCRCAGGGAYTRTGPRTGRLRSGRRADAAWPVSFVRAARPALPYGRRTRPEGSCRPPRVGYSCSPHQGGWRDAGCRGRCRRRALEGGTGGACVRDRPRRRRSCSRGGPRSCVRARGGEAGPRAQPRRVHRDAMTFYSSGADNRPTVGRGRGAGQVRTRLSGPFEWTQGPGRSYERGRVPAPVARFPARSGNQER